jgi:hypothetical protein
MTDGPVAGIRARRRNSSPASISQDRRNPATGLAQGERLRSSPGIVSETTWKKLVRELTSEGYESPYLDRLRARLDLRVAFESLEKEIAREMASALGRAGEKVDVALLRLDVAGREVDAAGDDRERRRAVERFNQLRREALRARHDLQIHREAIGIRRNRILEQIYPIPPRRR